MAPCLSNWWSFCELFMEMRDSGTWSLIENTCSKIVQMSAPGGESKTPVEAEQTATYYLKLSLRAELQSCSLCGYVKKSVCKAETFTSGYPWKSLYLLVNATCRHVSGWYRHFSSVIDTDFGSLDELLVKQIAYTWDCLVPEIRSLYIRIPLCEKHVGAEGGWVSSRHVSLICQSLPIL